MMPQVSLDLNGLIRFIIENIAVITTIIVQAHHRRFTAKSVTGTMP